MRRLPSLAILMLAASMFASGTAIAQGFGIKGGINSSTITGSPSPRFEVDFSSKIAGVGGISYAARLSDRVSLQLEALYFRRDVDSVSRGRRQFGFLRVTSIEVPMLAVFELSGGSTRMNIQLGPQVGFRVSESGAFEAGAGQGPDDLSEELASTYLGAVVGLGVKTPANVGTITFDARYVFGFGDVFKAGVRSGRKWNSLVLLVGYVF